MRTINANEIETTISDLCISSNKILPKSLEEKIVQTINYERNSLATEILKDLNKNIIAAKEMSLPICQDTGMAVVFAEVGQEIIIEGGDFEDAINNGVRKGYLEGLLRCSVVKDPLSRINTNDNTPAIIHTRIVPGDHLKLTVAPKGFGSENMSSLKMFTPAAGKSEIIDFVVNVIKLAGSNPCPPVIVGVGIGGDFEYCALLAKKSFMQRYIHK